VARARDLSYTGRTFTGADAARWGLVTESVPADELDAAVAELAAGLAGKSQAVLRLGRDAFYAVWDQGALDALAMLHPMLTVHTGLEDAAEGLAAFAEKRAPAWRDR
jgi:enoyl-CoA hydratase/carnithine racemase